MTPNIDEAMNEVVAFNEWWDAYRLRNWKLTLGPDELDKPMPDGWSAACKNYAQVAWLVRATRASDKGNATP